jgi:hypothetical protein
MRKMCITPAPIAGAAKPLEAALRQRMNVMQIFCITI